MNYNKLQQYEGIIDQPAGSLISAFQRHRSFDIIYPLQIFVSEFVRRTVVDAILSPPDASVMGMTPSTLESLFLWGPFTKLKRERQDIFSCATRQPLWAPSAPGVSYDLDFVGHGASEPKEVSMEYLEVLEAGTDAISFAFISALVFLMEHPEAMTCARNEVDRASFNGNLSDPPRWGEVCRLSFLDAVLKESVRHGPSSKSSMKKSVVSGGMTVSGHYLPARTVVKWQSDTFQNDQDIYGEDVEEFRPERWLFADLYARKRMEQALLAFNISRRTCVAVRAAWLELKKVFVLILLQFNVSYDFGLLDA